MSAPAPAVTPSLRPIEVVVLLATSAALVAASYFRWWPLAMTEVLGFATGGACVWLLVRQHIWNWPIGLANNLFFFVLFLRARLFADMGLQLVYFALGVYGWIMWARGAGRAPLRITRATRSEWLALAALVPLATWRLRLVLVAAGGAAPFGDALTTALSLGAQYLQCRKRLENWYLWIAADLIYVPLYLGRGLPLTAVLYTVFLAMCLVGLREWSRHWRQAAAVSDRPAA